MIDPKNATNVLKSGSIGELTNMVAAKLKAANLLKEIGILATSGLNPILHAGRFGECLLEIKNVGPFSYNNTPCFLGTEITLYRLSNKDNLWEQMGEPILCMAPHLETIKNAKIISKGQNNSLGISEDGELLEEMAAIKWVGDPIDE